MLKEAIHRLVSHPLIYDVVESALGLWQTRSVLRKYLKNIQPGATVLDLGGGTGGTTRGLLAAGVQHICLDEDQLKLRGFISNIPTGSAMLGNGLHIPF